MHRDQLTSIRMIQRKDNHQTQMAELSLRPDEDWADLLIRMLSILNAFDRASRNLFLPVILSIIGEKLEELYDCFLEKELLHIDLVRQVAKAAALPTGAEHDHTKDAYYLLVTCGKFGGIGANGSEEFETIFAEEVNRHYSLEPHHPQFEHFRQTECSYGDIAEMAVDRLARNVAINDGVIDHVTMNVFLPEFVLGDTVNKLAYYKDMVSKLEPTVLRLHEMLKGQYSERIVSIKHRGSSHKCISISTHCVTPGEFHIEVHESCRHFET